MNIYIGIREVNFQIEKGKRGGEYRVLLRISQNTNEIETTLSVKESRVLAEALKL